MDVKVHRTTIRRRAGRYAGGLRPSTGSIRGCDEKFIRVKALIIQNAAPAAAAQAKVSRASRRPDG